MLPRFALPMVEPTMVLALLVPRCPCNLAPLSPLAPAVVLSRVELQLKLVAT